MPRLKIRQGDWVVVCDGKKALVLENAGDEKFLNLKTREVHEQAIRRRAIWAPMRRAAPSIPSDARRSAMEQTDWHEQEENRFLQQAGRPSRCRGECRARPSR